MQKAALAVAGLIFAIGAVGHGVRLATGFGIVIDGIVVPQWVSYPGVLVAAGLAVWMAVAARRA